MSLQAKIAEFCQAKEENEIGRSLDAIAEEHYLLKRQSFESQLAGLDEIKNQNLEQIFDLVERGIIPSDDPIITEYFKKLDKLDDCDKALEESRAAVREFAPKLSEGAR